MVVKILIATIGLCVYFINILIPYSWYCAELRGMGTLESIVFSHCFISNILYSMLIVGLLWILNLAKLNSKNIMMLLSIIIFIGVGLHHVNTHGLEHSVAIQFDVILQVLKSYLGSFIGIILGILYFNKIKNIKLSLLYLVLIWMFVNIVQPFINWEYIFG